MKGRLKRFWVLMRKYLNRISLPGMKGLGLFSVLKFFWHGMKEQNLQLGAMAMAFRFFFSLFPALMILFSLVKYIPVENLEKQIFDFIGTVLPEQGGVQLIRSIVGGSGAGLFSLNLLLLLVSAVGAVKVMIHAFYRNDEFVVKRTFIRFNLVALGIFCLLMCIFLVAGAIIISGELYINSLSDGTGGWEVFFLRLFHNLVILLSVILGISVMYYFGPKMQSRFSFLSPGSVTAGIFILLASAVFRAVVARFFNYELYAGLSAIMLLMLWFYWLSFVILVGFELNRAIERLTRMKEN